MTADDTMDFKPKKLLGIRHVQVMMLFLALVFSFAMRVNMSMAIVAMTDSNNENSFDWDIKIQSVVLSSFFWGYVVLQIPGGELAGRFGGMILITLCVGINSVVSLVIPIGSHYGGWQLVCGCRVLQGLSQGFLFPAIHNLIGNWVPLEEKSRLGTVIYAGAQLGTALQLMASGFIAEAWSWEGIFYTNGVLGCIWTVAYILLGSSSPQASKMISQEERFYIQNSLGHVGGKKKLQTPWKAIWTSLPFISLIVVHCGQNWGFWTLMTEMPSYMNKVLGVNIKANGLMSALPYLAMYLFSFPCGFASDYILKKKWLSITASRKLSNSLGHFGPAIALIGLSYVPAGNVTMAVALLTTVVGLNAGHYTGYLLVHIDMAPNFAGTLMGITNCIANIISIIAPLAAGAILNDETDANEWRKVFYVSSGIYIVCNLFFLLFGTSERQKWNDVAETDDTETDPSQRCIPVRYIQICMLFLGFMLAYCVRVMMSLAIVAMTDQSTDNSFDWSIQRQSVILSSFTWGYILLQSIAGELASRFGGMTLLTIAIGCNSIISLLLPVSAKYGGWMVVCVCRGIQGLTQGVIYPSMHYLISKWVPLEEKSRVTSFTFAGLCGPALALICLSHVPAGNITAALLILVTALGLHAGFYNGCIVVHLDMAPNFASSLIAVCNFISNFVGLFAPLAVGFILDDETNPKEWRIVFYIMAMMYICTNMFFVIFGTSKRQKWNEGSELTPKV
ncbi:putative inorganic phosphate cotransporter isoform X2 [Epargyreus clarus]|uniref:putative inorganic phosphate cotransporter isoform X2 n=1 Tax=Epargyreus clarus TaxID=520877 RepID=UPI003C2EB385